MAREGLERRVMAPGNAAEPYSNKLRALRAPF
jgi:hypothetical protein